jgi:hypothetical protein
MSLMSPVASTSEIERGENMPMIHSHPPPGPTVAPSGMGVSWPAATCALSGCEAGKIRTVCVSLAYQIIRCPSRPEE